MTRDEAMTGKQEREIMALMIEAIPEFTRAQAGFLLGHKEMLSRQITAVFKTFEERFAEICREEKKVEAEMWARSH